MKVETQSPPELDARSEYSELQAEASRLLNFKRRNLKNQNQTPCPSCSTLVHINANRCPHCSSDIAPHTALAREEMMKLNKILTELYQLQKRDMQRQEEETTKRPYWERITTFLSDPQLREDMRIVLPSVVLFFLLIVSLRLIAHEWLFWSVSLVGGFFAYTLFKRSSLSRTITVDLYRTVLVVGLAMVLSSAVSGPVAVTPKKTVTSIQVQPPLVNIRERATTNSPVVTTVRKGDKLQVLEHKGSWYKIQTPDGKTGWVYTSLVK